MLCVLSPYGETKQRDIVLTEEPKLGLGRVSNAARAFALGPRTSNLTVFYAVFVCVGRWMGSQGASYVASSYWVSSKT